MMDLSRLSDDDLRALRSNNLAGVSDEGLRFLSSAQAGDATKPGEIPGAGPYRAPPATPERAGEPSIPQKMAMYGASVPAAGLVAGGVRAATRGTAAAPYTARAAEALIPKTLGGLTGATTLGAATAIPGEYSRRAAERAGAGPVGQMVAETAGATVGALPAVGAYQAGKGLARTFGQAFSGEARDLGQRLARTSQERAAEAIAQARAGQKAPSEELQRIERAQTELAGRGRVAGQRQAAREQTVESSLSAISPQRGVLAEDVGGVIQPLGRENIRKLSETRQREAITNIKDPGFAAAREREARGEFMATDPNSAPLYKEVLRELDDQIAKTPEPFRTELRRRMESLRGEKVSLSGKEASYEKSLARMQGRAPVLERTRPATLDQAEFMRRLLTDKDLGDASGFAAIDVSRRVDLGKKLASAMEAFEPRTRQYTETYRRLSAPIEQATAGRGAALTEADLVDEQKLLFGADKQAVTKYYLDGSQERAQRLLSLVGGKRPEVMNAVRGYLRSELENKTSQKAQEFVAKNEGLLRVFPEFKDAMQQVVANKRVAETAGEAATTRAAEAGKRLEAAAKGPAKTVEERRALQARYEGLQNALLQAAPGKEVDAAKTLVNTLYKDKLIDSVDHRNLLEQIANVERTAKTQAEAKQKLKRIALGFGGAAGTLGAIGTMSFP